jgi:hypothetical protein
MHDYTNIFKSTILTGWYEGDSHHGETFTLNYLYIYFIFTKSFIVYHSVCGTQSMIMLHGFLRCF